MISYTRNGDGTGTLTIEFTNTQDKIETFIEDLAEGLHDDVTIDFNTLTNQEKLELINGNVRTLFQARVDGVRKFRALSNVPKAEL